MTDQRTADRRRTRDRLRYPERRTGFDRRTPAGVIGWYRDHPNVIATVLLGVVLLNLADYLLTLRALDRGASEVNPVMAALFEVGPAAAGSVKLLLGFGVVLVMWQMRRYRRILAASLVALGGFSAVLVYQVTLVASGA